MEINSEAKAIFEDRLPGIYRCAMMCISSTGKFLSYGQDKALKENVKVGLEHNDLQPLREFLGLLQRSMAWAKQHFTEFKETCEAVKTSCTTAAEKCQHNTRSKKIATRAVGGAATAIVLASGAGTAVALSGAAVSIAASSHLVLGQR